MAHEVIDKLKEDYDSETVMYKMATLLIKKQDIKDLFRLKFKIKSIII